jgi:hypothetical protein
VSAIGVDIVSPTGKMSTKPDQVHGPAVISQDQPVMESASCTLPQVLLLAFNRGPHVRTTRFSQAVLFARGFERNDAFLKSVLLTGRAVGEYPEPNGHQHRSGADD